MGPIQDGREDAAAEDEDPEAVVDDTGRAGNAAEDCDFDFLPPVELATQPGTVRDGVGAGPPNRVLFLSLRTLVECFCDGAAA